MHAICDLLPQSPEIITSWRPTDLYLIRNEAKRKLLNVRKNTPEPVKSEGNTLMTDLGHLSHSVQSRYFAKTGHMDDLPFRLYNPNRSERTDPESDETSYIALSYRWTKPPAKIPVSDGIALPLVSEYELPVSDLMFQTVLEQRESQDEGLWCDQICINQGSHDEVGHIAQF